LGHRRIRPALTSDSGYPGISSALVRGYKSAHKWKSAIRTTQE
jgi:hypothetical protein